MGSQTRQAKWARENTRNVVGLRVKRAVMLYDADDSTLNTTMMVQPTDFLWRGRGSTKPYRIWGTNFSIHVPRSICVRAGLTVHKKDGHIIARRNLPFANKK